MARVSINGEWHDLTKWTQYHPGGARILEIFDGFDATEAFYSLHSKEAVQMLQKRRPLETKEPAKPVHPADQALREFSQQLEKDGYFKREFLQEFRLVGLIFLMAGLGTYWSYTYPLLSIVLIGVAMQQAGWLGHDMTHARNSPYCDFMLRFVSGWINGFDRNWWSYKHNTHHVVTNHVTLDPDIHNQPFLFLWAPSKAIDNHLRRYQHLYYLPLYTALYVSWRQQSLMWSWSHRDYVSLFVNIMPSYIWLATLPLAVSIGSVLLGGLLVAIVVTMSHESEEMLFEREPSYCVNQFVCTRNIVCPDFITEYLFGGMQYQLEHHLFPTLPRYKHPRIVPLVKEFAKKNGLTYKADGLVTMWRAHYDSLRKNAQAPTRNIEHPDDVLRAY